ncbi:VWA domain-containing protein [Thermosynechococcaceae cyanobacterium Okahandja]
MTHPQVELIPLRPALCRDKDITLDVLIKITVSGAAQPPQRPALNLGLVIDRSGSMAGQKLAYARQAASFVVNELLSSDRVSITIFDNHVATLVPNTPALDKPYLLGQIRGIHSGGTTALHQGWLNGAEETKRFVSSQALNRVLLLSDGLANVGETNPDRIAQTVHHYAQQGISTSTLGVGLDYSEDLLAAMASSGDGNFYHIENPDQLPAIFLNELQGLVTTVGREVNLGVEPYGNVTLNQVLNRLPQTPTGAYQLANLVMDLPLLVVARLQVPPTPASSSVLTVNLSWIDLATSSRQTLCQTLNLEVVSAAEWEALVENPEVRAQVMLLEAAAAREQAIHYTDSGDVEEAAAVIQATTDALSCLCFDFFDLEELDLSVSFPIRQEIDALEDLKQDLAERKLPSLRKKMRGQSYNRYRSKPL